MTSNKNYYTSSNYAGSPIPSREEFHRYASNMLAVGDFSTNYPSGYQIDRIARALRWTIGNERGRNKKNN